MAYEIEIEAAASRSIMRMQRADQRKIIERIQALGENPRPRGVEKLSGMHDTYRIRSGAFRIVYLVDDTTNVVTVTRAGHRRDVYRRMR